MRFTTDSHLISLRSRGSASRSEVSLSPDGRGVGVEQLSDPAFSCRLEGCVREELGYALIGLVVLAMAVAIWWSIRRGRQEPSSLRVDLNRKREP